MSVINRMLKDLDQRQHRPADEQYTPAAIAPEPVRWGLWAGIGLAVLAVAGGSWWWLATAPMPAQAVQPDQVTELQQPQVTEPLQTAEVQQLEVQKPELQQPEVKQPIAEQVDLQQQREADALAVQAAEQLAAEQLAAEQLAAEQLAAEQLAAEQLAAEQLAQQQQTAQTQVPLYQKQVEQPKQQVEQRDDSSFAIERVQLSPAELAESNLAKARTAFRQGEREKAQDLLEKALIVMPEHVAVRSELAAYWYGRGMSSRALSLLRQGLDLRPQQSQWQLLYARILERSGRIQDAYDALRYVEADTEDALELLQLRAASANQLGLFAEAAADYTELAGDLQQGRWWIAAAVAYEDANNITAAVQAYRQALNFSDLNSDAVTYASQRIRALGGQ
ncbi:tetratricopeptide repeat protein [Pseudidiomarina mangrovi]|uniref:tetratricopeptide repeat protein n=1 Tax=Pseudidiomarina mangrovi TaxID=2487133 RepID=UPI000FCB236E|nr:tetratricopeptide repeat protein [Pseudidiomarina mangrovi]